MRSPITFRDWLGIVGIVFFLGAGFLLLGQIPFIRDFLEEIWDFVGVQGEYIY